VILTGKWEV